MLQRVQSLLLLAASALSSLCCFFPFAYGGKNDTLFLDEQLTIDDNLALMILVIAVIALPLLAIFLYKNYNLQKKITTIVILAAFSLFGTATFLLFTAGVLFSFGIAIFPPFAVMILAYIALRGIKKDENIIKSANRIR